METLEEAELCFPQFPNTSCKKPPHQHSEAVAFYTILSCISFLTVALNLLVIISISHFRQLHTSTNLLLLSLAVSDFLVGLFLMPVRMVKWGCWFLGNAMCGLYYYASFILTSASVGNMVLISVDRYVAICDPLYYLSKVTQERVKVSVCLCWALSVLYNGVILHVYLSHPGKYNSCHGKCTIVIDSITGAVDVAITFIGPIAVIVCLYMKVFVVAVSQARAMRSHITAVTVQGSVKVTAKKSERKAAGTLGVVVVVFLLCFCPYFFPSLAGDGVNGSILLSIYGTWLLYFNSCLNPLIYALFYPWFRKSVKLIVTLKIFQPCSCDSNIL